MLKRNGAKTTVSTKFVDLQDNPERIILSDYNFDIGVTKNFNFARLFSSQRTESLLVS
jgi:hypothetical protein